MEAAAAVILAAAVAATGWSQGAPADDKSIPTSKVERLNRAPVSKEILKVKLPRPVETTLPNGISLMILEDHRFPLVTVQFDIDGAGPMYEPAGQPGLAGATARLLVEGTKTRTSKQIAEQIDSLGASLSASAGFGSGSTNVAASGLSDTFEKWFALTADVLLHPLATRIFGQSNDEPRVVRPLSRGGRFTHARVSRFADAGDARGMARHSLRAAKHDSGDFGRRPRGDAHTEAAAMAGGVAEIGCARKVCSRSPACK
jgi:hypothetical protein